MARTKARKPLRKRPRQSRSRATVEAIVEAAAQLFERHGVAATTTDRIAARAGVSVGSLYQYFSNKEALLLALAERHLDDAEGRLEAALGAARKPDLGLEELITGLLGVLFAIHRERPALHRILTEETPLPRALRRRVERLEASAAEGLAPMLAAHPEVRVADPMLAAQLLVVWADAFAHRLVIRPPEGASAEALAEEAARLALAYLRAPAGERDA